MKKQLCALLLAGLLLLPAACGTPATPLDQAQARYLENPELAAKEGYFVETDGQITAGQTALERFAAVETQSLRLVSARKRTPRKAIRRGCRRSPAARRATPCWNTTRGSFPSSSTPICITALMTAPAE